MRYILDANQAHSKSFTLKMEAICSSKTSALTRTTQHHHIPEDRILHCYSHENTNLTLLSSMGRLIITFDEEMASQLYLHINTVTWQWRYRYNGFPSLSSVRYILTENQRDSESFILKMVAICSSETLVLTRTTWNHPTWQQSSLLLP
jgi:hypothetical protein